MIEHEHHEITQADYDSSYQKGYDAGRSEGFDQGFNGAKTFYENLEAKWKCAFLMVASTIFGYMVAWIVIP